MADVFLYIGKAEVYLILFYIFFRLFLSHTTFFRFNRLVLITGMYICALLPLIEIQVSSSSMLHAPIQSIHELFELEVPTSELQSSIDHVPMVDVDPGIVGKSMFTYVLWIVAGVYLSGLVAVIIHFSLSLLRLFQLIHSSGKEKYGKYTLIIKKEAVCSFSWGKYIVISATDYNNNPREILLHESMHLKNNHTVDLFLIQLLIIVHWFNPVVWLLKRELQEIHEFEADNEVINTGIDATRYQLLLVKKAVGTRLYSMTNGFNHSKLKNRITMMLKEKTSKWAQLRIFLLVPLMAGVLFVFAHPEVKTKVEPLVSALELPEESVASLAEYFENELQTYEKEALGTTLTKDERVEKFTASQALYVNAIDQIMLTPDLVSFDQLRSKLMEVISKKQQKDTPFLLYLLYDGDTSNEMRKQVFSLLKEVSTELKKKTSQKFPMLVWNDKGEYFRYRDSQSGKKKNALSSNQRLKDIEVTLYAEQGDKKVLTDFTLDELEKELAQMNGEKETCTVVGIKAGPEVKMSVISDLKKVFSNNQISKVSMFRFSTL